MQKILSIIVIISHLLCCQITLFANSTGHRLLKIDSILDSYLSVTHGTDIAVEIGADYTIISQESSVEIGTAKLIKNDGDIGLYELIDVKPDYKLKRGDYISLPFMGSDTTMEIASTNINTGERLTLSRDQAYHMGRMEAEKHYRGTRIGVVGGGIGFLFGLIGVGVGFLPILAAPDPLPKEYAPGLSAADSVYFADGYAHRSKQIRRSSYLIGGGIGALGAGVYVASKDSEYNEQ